MNASIIQGAALTTAIACGMLSVTAHAQGTAPDRAAAPPVRVTLDDRPSIRFGRIARIDLRLTLQMDGRAEIAIDPDESRASWSRTRAGVDGVVAGLFSFQTSATSHRREWRDVHQHRSTPSGAGRPVQALQP
jgi:hypothetical protein